MLFKKTVNSILSNINKSIADLKAFAESEIEIAKAERDKAQTLDDSADARIKEVTRATRVAAKLEDLILVPVDDAD